MCTRQNIYVMYRVHVFYHETLIFYRYTKRKIEKFVLDSKFYEERKQVPLV